MIVGITGSTGFIGRALAGAASQRGWTVVALARQPDARSLAGLDAVVHLAGESVDGRWTAQKKAEIRRSRVEGTRALVAAIAGCPNRPRVLVSASAVGFYGARGDEPLFERSAPGSDFLARVCLEWEREARAAEQLGVRTVMLRTGIVLGPGGALPRMMKPFTFGAGGPLGAGTQFVPWIHLDDVVALYLHAIESQSLSGAVNAVAPDYATSARFAQAIGAAMRRPALAPAPGFALRALLGEFAETLLASQLVIPQRARASGFHWSHPRLEEAIQTIVNPSRETKLLRTFASEQIISAPPERVFAFFSDPRNLQAITPPSLRFDLKSEVRTVTEGTTIDYALRLHGVPLSWKTLIARWEPPHRFVDVQLHGPYALWEHEHTFTQVEDGVRMEDRVTYVLPFQPLGGLAEPFVRRDVEEIFRFRSRTIAQAFQ